MAHVHAKDTNLWRLPEHALAYLEQADAIPHRAEGEAVMLECLSSRRLTHFLDLGSGDGRLVALIGAIHPAASVVALDFSDTMLQRLEERFSANRAITVIRHDMSATLPPGHREYDAVVSSFAIHHLTHERKRSLYEEVFACLAPGGLFCNLEHVASGSPALHQQFLDALGIPPGEEDPSNKLLDVETQLTWLRQIGFDDVDCLWKWRELALLVGVKQ